MLFVCLFVCLFYFYFIFHLLLGTGAPHKCGTIRSSQCVAGISKSAANNTYPAVYHGGCWIIEHYVSYLAVANPTPRPAAITGSKVGSRFCATGHVHILTPACDFHFFFKAHWANSFHNFQNFARLTFTLLHVSHLQCCRNANWLEMCRWRLNCTQLASILAMLWGRRPNNINPPASSPRDIHEQWHVTQDHVIRTFANLQVATRRSIYEFYYINLPSAANSSWIPFGDRRRYRSSGLLLGQNTRSCCKKAVHFFLKPHN